MDKPGAVNKKFKKNYSNQLFYTHNNFLIKFYISRNNL